jgi:hypothetical protein
MADTNNTPDRSLDLTAEELKIIEYFVQGQKHSISSQNLKLEYTETSIRLNDRQGKLLGISKQTNQWQRKVLVSNSSVYRFRIIDLLIGSKFINKQKSSHPEFTEYHYYDVPDGYKLNYTEVIELWKVWWHNKRYQLNVPNPPIDVLIFSKGDWCLVRDLQPKQDNFILRTAKKEITVESEEYLVWISSLLTILPPAGSNRSVTLDSSLPSEDHILNEIIQSPVKPMAQLELPVDRQSLDRRSQHSFFTDHINELPESEEEIDLESYLSTFNTDDSEDIDRIEGIYHIGELLSNSNNVLDDLPPPPPPRRPTKLPLQVPARSDSEQVTTPVEAPASPEPTVATADPNQSPISSSQRQELLKYKAMNVLANYLQKGERIVRTEVLKNAQGQEIDRKITKIQRGCPSWAIDQIEKLTSVDN